MFSIHVRSQEANGGQKECAVHNFRSKIWPQPMNRSHIMKMVWTILKIHHASVCTSGGDRVTSHDVLAILKANALFPRAPKSQAIH